MNNTLRFALVGALCALPSLAQACSCLAPPAPKVALEKSAAVFVGRVAKVESSAGVNTFQFAVSKQWKGVDGSVVSVASNSSSAACGIAFDSDRDYLIYAYKYEGDNQLRTNLCTRTKRVSDAAEDLAELGEPAKNAPAKYTRNSSYGMEMQVNASEIGQLNRTLQANPNSRMFRLNWPVSGKDAITAIYDRANSTLKFYSKLHGAGQTSVKSAEYSGATDQTLARWSQNYQSPSQFAQVIRYGATQISSNNRKFAR